MLIQFVQEGLESQLLNMWIDYIAPAIICLCLWIFMVYFTLKLIEDYKIKKQKGRYREEDDIGKRKQGGSKGRETNTKPSTRGSGNSKRRKSEIQNAVEHARRELLSD